MNFKLITVKAMVQAGGVVALSNQIGVSRQTIHAWLNGIVAPRSAHLMRLLALAEQKGLKVIKADEVIKICEMVTVGGYAFKHDQFEIRVYEEPMQNPSFHFRNETEDYEVVLQIKDLKVLEWKKPKNGRFVKIQDFRSLVVWFKSIPAYDDTAPMWWDLMIRDWNKLNPKSRWVTPIPKYEEILANGNPTQAWK